MKKITFELYRYQILPIDRQIQGNLLTGVNSVEELINRKNEFFEESLKLSKLLTNKKTKVRTLYQEDNFFLFQFAKNKTMKIETEDFKTQDLENWPSVYVVIWNDPQVQLIAVQKRTSVYPKSESVVKQIMQSIQNQLLHHHLVAIYNPLFEKNGFWALLDRYKGKVQSVNFEIITPNMANISHVLSDDLKNFAKTTNATTTNIKIKSDKKSALSLDKSDENLSSLVEYTSEGGGDIMVKIKNINKTHKTTKTVKTVSADELLIQGKGETVIQMLKEILK